MSAKNMVIAGDYLGKPVTGVGGTAQIFLDRKNYVLLDKFEIDTYEIITEDTRKSAASGIARRGRGSRVTWPCRVACWAFRKKQKHCCRGNSF